MRATPVAAAFGAAALLTACPSSGERRARVLVRAERALAAGNADQAATLLRHQLDETPRDPVVAARLAAILEPADPNGAFAVLASLPEDASRDDVAYRRLLARLHVAAGRLEPAALLLVALERDRLAEPDTVRAFLEALAARGGAEGIERPLPPEWRVRIAGLLVDRTAPREAAVALERVPAGTGRDAVLDRLLGTLLEGDATAALAGHETLLDGPPSPRKLLVRHRLLLSRGAWGPAAAVEEEFRRLYPEHPERHAMIVAMARRHGSQGDGRAALALAAEALRLSPGSVPALVEKARALDTLGRRSEARRSWQLVLELDPGNGTAARFLEETAPRPGPSPATPVSIHLDVQGAAR